MMGRIVMRTLAIVIALLEKVPKETVIAEAKKIVDARVSTNGDGSPRG
jgi:hypothetical protein